MLFLVFFVFFCFVNKLFNVVSCIHRMRKAYTIGWIVMMYTNYIYINAFLRIAKASSDITRVRLMPKYFSVLYNILWLRFGVYSGCSRTINRKIISTFAHHSHYNCLVTYMIIGALAVLLFYKYARIVNERIMWWLRVHVHVLISRTLHFCCSSSLSIFRSSHSPILQPKSQKKRS